LPLYLPLCKRPETGFCIACPWFLEYLAGYQKLRQVLVSKTSKGHFFSVLSLLATVPFCVMFKKIWGIPSRKYDLFTDSIKKTLAQGSPGWESKHDPSQIGLRRKNSLVLQRPWRCNTVATCDVLSDDVCFVNFPHGGAVVGAARPVGGGQGGAFLFAPLFPLFLGRALSCREKRDKPWTKYLYKTPNPKCRLYWCLIEFRDWRYSQSWWYFRPLLWSSAPLTFSLVHYPHPLPFYLCLYLNLCFYFVF
jgi:hypothetical protein